MSAAETAEGGSEPAGGGNGTGWFVRGFRFTADRPFATRPNPQAQQWIARMPRMESRPSSSGVAAMAVGVGPSRAPSGVLGFVPAVFEVPWRGGKKLPVQHEWSS